MIKRISAILLCLVLLATMVACKGKNDPAETTATTTEAPVTTTAPATTLPKPDIPDGPSSEGLKRAELSDYLSNVTYNRFELTEEREPYFMGRWFEKEIDGVSHMVTTTDGSLLYFATYGATSFDVNFTLITERETPYFAYSIDGATPVRQLITNPTVTLPDSEPHTVRIIADGLTAYEDKWEGERGFALKGVTASEGGDIYGIKPINKVIFYFGDSITEGILALGSAENLTANSNTNSATASYAWACSEALGAVHYSVGYSGSGIVKAGSFAPFADAVDHLSKDRLVSDAIKPDVIVINHGCNDIEMSTPAQTFAAGVQSGIAKLNEMYPDTPIYYVVPFAQRWALKLGSIVRGFDNVTVIQSADWVSDDMYVDGIHPSAAAAKTLGENLAVALKEQLGEDFFR